MISEALIFLKDHLKTHLETHLKTHLKTDESVPEKVKFVGRDAGDSIQFEKEAVSVLIVGIEEEKTLRAAAPYTRTSPNGTSRRVQPDIRLNLYVLFATNFKVYENGLRYLSLIIQHFQTHNVFDHRGETELSDEIEQLIMELHTLTLPEQHELWQALGTAYRPSVLYKVKMVVFSDEAGETIPSVTETDLSVRRLP